MKSITIHGIDAELNDGITQKSREYGLSLNRTIKKILTDALAVDKESARRAEFSDLFGSWSVEEQAEFEERIKDLSEINEGDWQNAENPA